MKLGKSISLSTTFGLSLLLAGTWPSVVLAEEEEVEELVIIGTRAQPRSVMDSSVPIDVIDSESLTDQGSGDMNYMLRTVVPSYHVSIQPGRDEAALQNPINMRGLAPDHTLVLVNGKRRHRGATITWISDGRSDGAQGPDVSVIPGIALKQVEVLRDGAAAQYGSDAIAGVVNFVLKDDSEGATLEARYGAYGEDGDEDKTRVSGNVGLPLTEHGFANFSFEYSSDSPTDRSDLRNDVRAMEAAGNTHIANPAHVWGSPDIDDNIKTFVNLGIDLDADRRVYAFGNYASREVDTGFFYRSPKNRSGVFVKSSNESQVLLFGTGCSTYTDLSIQDSGLPAIYEQLKADDSCFSFHEWFPGGFQPRFGADVTDYSVVVGMKGVAHSIGSGLSYDISASIGENEADYFIRNTVNASWGPDSPTSFDVGKYIQTETNLNIDVSYMADVGLASDLSVAGGLEWREEEFEATTGDVESWQWGEYRTDTANGSNGYAGFSEQASGKWDRENVAAYIDLEADVLPNWTVGGALRWEDFDDFGTTTNAKLSTRFQMADPLAFRASLGTGFRAPSPGQQNASKISTIFVTGLNPSDPPVSVQTGIVAPDSATARKFGGGTLDSEESDSFSVGFVLDLDALNITVDYFRTDVDDRIFLSDEIDLTCPVGETDRGTLSEDKQKGCKNTFDRYDQNNVSQADVDELKENFSELQFFENDFDTETDGFDIVMTYSVVSNMGDTDFLVSYNRTDTKVTKSSNLSASLKKRVEESVPDTRYSLTANHAMGDWRLMLRYNYFGDWYSWYDTTDYKGYGLADISVTRKFGGFSLTLGSDNFLDEHPDRSLGAAGRGSRYPRFAPGGIDGRFIYARAMLEF